MTQVTFCAIIVHYGNDVWQDEGNDEVKLQKDSVIMHEKCYVSRMMRHSVEVVTEQGFT